MLRLTVSAKPMLGDDSGVYCPDCGDEISGEWLDGLVIPPSGLDVDCSDCGEPFVIFQVDRYEYEAGR